MRRYKQGKYRTEQKVLRLAPIQGKDKIYLSYKEEYFVGGEVVNYFYDSSRYLIENTKAHFNPNKAAEHKSYEEQLTIRELLTLKDRLNGKRL